MRFPKIPVLVTSFITLIIIILNYFLSGTFWEDWEIEPSIVQGCFCEHNYLERFISNHLIHGRTLHFYTPEF